MYINFYDFLIYCKERVKVLKKKNFPNLIRVIKPIIERKPIINQSKKVKVRLVNNQLKKDQCLICTFQLIAW